MEQKKSLTAWTIALINVAAICNIKNFALNAEYGLSSAFFLILCSLIFFIPVSLVAAELASGWPDRGLYTWVREGLGARLGFMAIWLQWIANVIWYPTVLSFIAATFAYLFMPELAENKTYILTIILVTFWAATFANFFGMRVSATISSLTALFGTILPITLIILLGLCWVIGGYPLHITLSWDSFFPNLTSLNHLVLLSGFFLGLTGMEMSAVHAREVQNPKREYPKAILLSALLIIVLSTLGSVTIAALVPAEEINLTSAGIEAFSALFLAFGLKWAIPLIAAIMTFGALGMMSTWIVGPSRGLYAATEHGDLPPLFHYKNKSGMPVAILIAQAVIVTFLSLVFVCMPNVNASYFILVALASSLNMIMYLLMFCAALRLRATHPNVQRTYHVPGGKYGIWIVSCLGMSGPLFVLTIGFFPPAHLETGSPLIYETILIGGCIFFTILPLIFYKMRKPEWKLDVLGN
jgi:putative glutamate/gamma-aminobutyrate antiporter